MARDTEPAAVRPTRPATVLMLASAATFLAFLDTTVVNVAFPALHEDFDRTSVATLSWVVSAYAVLFAALLTPAGRLADVTGRRRLFLASILGFTLASAACALAPSVGVLIAGRAVQGASAAGMIPAALAIVLFEMPPQRRAAAVGVWGAAGSMAAAAGPSLGGLLIEWTSWRAVFVINVPLGLAVVLGGAAALRSDRPTQRRLPDLVGTAAITVGVGLVVAGLTEAEDWGWTSGATLGTLAGGLLLLGVGLLRSRRHPVPAVETTLWRSRRFAVANLTSLLSGVGMFAWLLSGPLFLTSVWHYSILEAGLAVTPGAFTSALAAIATGRRADPRQQRVAVVAGMVLFAINALWMYFGVGSEPRFLAVWLPAGLIGGAGLGAAMTGLSTAAAMAVPPDRFATGTGLNTTARQLGGALGVAAVAAILAARGVLGPLAYREVFLLSAVAGVAAALAGLSLLERPAPAPARSADLSEPDRTG